MGLILSTFRHKKSSLQELEEIEYTISAIEEYNNNVEQRYRMVGRLLIYIVSLFTVAACGFAYFWKLRNVKEQLLFTLFLLTLFLVTIYLKKIMSWYYNHKIKKNRSKLFDIKEKKKKIIENVMENETYKVAKEILDKYAPDKVSPKFKFNGNEIARMPTNRASLNTVPFKQPLGMKPVQQIRPVGGLTSTLPLIPVGIVPSGLSTRLDRFLEYLIGDGPTNRYALICKSCHTHNGMALKEEFPYTGFKCCHCKILNPARMLRPPPPQILDSPANNTSDTTDEIDSKLMESLIDTTVESEIMEHDVTKYAEKEKSGKVEKSEEE